MSGGIVENRSKDEQTLIMAVKSQPLNQKALTLVSSDVYSTSETVQSQSNLSDQFSQLQIEIQQLTDTISQLETPSIFQPPHRLMPLEERLQLHFQSIKGEKDRVKQLQQSKQTLALKQEELKQLEPQLNQRKLEAAQAIERLEQVAQSVKQTESAYSQAIEEFQVMAELAHQALIEAYGQQGQFMLETEMTPQYLALGKSLPQLTPSS
jgi:chromosome segregation ATPase